MGEKEGRKFILFGALKKKGGSLRHVDLTYDQSCLQLALKSTKINMAKRRRDVPRKSTCLVMIQILGKYNSYYPHSIWAK